MDEKLEIIEDLKNALDDAKKIITEQDNLIQKITSEPLSYGIVIKNDEIHDYKKDYKRFKIGSKVRLKQDSKYFYQSENGIGVIKDNSKTKGWVTIEWENGNSNAYRTGELNKDHIESEDKYCDLILLDKNRRITIVDSKGNKSSAISARNDIKIGDTVLISSITGQIIDKTASIKIGEIFIVKSIIDEIRSEIEYNSIIKIVFNSPNTVTVGDKVVVDGSFSVILDNLGKEDKSFNIDLETLKVSWDDIGGLEDAKKEMIEAIEMPFKYPDMYKFYHKKPIKGVLLYGPPGCGKTMLGKATAYSIANIHKGDLSTSSFIYIKGPEILSMYVGMAELTIRQLFVRAKKHKEEFGYPSVIFIDEADAILGRRGMGISSDVERTIVPAFLAEMDGLEDSGAIVILATNRIDVLDPAVIREGRIDRKIKITRPKLEEVSDIFKIYLKHIPLNKGYKHSDLALNATNEIFSPAKMLYDIATKDGIKSFGFKEIVSGSMVAGIVDRATSISMNRDFAETTTKKLKPGGLKHDDLIAAIDSIYKEHYDINHNNDIKDFVGSDEFNIMKKYDTREVEK